MMRRKKLYRTTLALFIVTAFLTTLAPQARVICKCRSTETPGKAAPLPACGGSCAMNTPSAPSGLEAIPDADHGTGCDCDNCRHVELTIPGAQPFIPETIALAHGEDARPLSDVTAVDGRQGNEDGSFVDLGKENRFTLQIAELLSSSVMRC